MMEVTLKKRLYTTLPGRLRLELFGIKHNPTICQKFEDIFLKIEGVHSVKANEATGKVLISYDEHLLPIEILILYLQKFEETLIRKEIQQNTEVMEASVEEVAASAESTVQPAYLQTVPEVKREINSNSPPLPLTLAVTGVGALGMKQLIWGRSAISRHPIPFYLSGVLAIGTGYSFFRQGFKRLNQGKKAAFDFLLGASSLALALLRENLVVLMGMSLLQYLNWKRQSQLNGFNGENISYLDENAEKYSRKMGRIGLLASGVSFAITRNPLASFALLLAANPRPATISGEYTWKQAEYLAEESGQFRPQNGSMKQLSKVKVVVFDDVSLLYDQNGIKKECQSFLEKLPYTTEITYLHNQKGIAYSEIRRLIMNHYGLRVKLNDEIQPYEREEILFVTSNSQTKSKVVSFYPTVKVSELSRMIESYEKSQTIQKQIKGYIRSTRIWNIVGSILAIPFATSAPLINLMADGLTLSFLVHAKRKTEELFPFNKNEARKKKVAVSWHTLKNKDILHTLNADLINGLTEQEVKKRMKKYGKNILQPKERPHWIKDYIGQLKEFTTIILGATALISLFTGHFVDGLAMSSILILNGGIGTFQERKTQKTVEMMTKFVPPNCHVIRNGETKEKSAEELVPGDIVMIEAGERVPADLRILEAWNLEVDESALTGESLPVVKGAIPVEEKATINDRSNMLYMGTHITRGKAKAIVVETANNTEIGHLFQMLSDDTEEETPLQKQVTKISKAFMKTALVIGGIVFAVGLIRGFPVTEMIPSTLALTASAIPEGLPVTITVALTAGIIRMAKKNSLTRKISALETLGRVTVVCSDKTGTLTKNEMTIKKVSTVDNEYKVTGDGYAPDGDIIDSNGQKAKSKELEKLIQVGVLCSDTVLYQEEHQWKIKGDPTEGALLVLASKKGMKDRYNHWKRVHEIPFDSNRGLMSVVCHEIEDECFVMTKGSVEKILEYCKYYEKDGQKQLLTNGIRKSILSKTEEYAHESLRTLGFAYRPLQKEEPCDDNIEKDLIFLGMVGMIDPPKEEVKESIQEAIKLGVKPVMITGDHPMTARAIAKQIGIPANEENIVTGIQLDSMTEDQLATIIQNITVFARVTPDHKLKIVKAFQKHGEIVAMTGDGVNDSLAIKQADVGIAMGQTGTQLTKETADIVLNKDDFGGIVEGIKEGRTIIGNIRKALGCLLCGNLAEIIVTSTSVIAGLPLPIIPIQILLMNLITDALPAMVLAVNPGDKTKQTKRQEIADKTLYKEVVTRGLLLGVGSLAVFALSLQNGVGLIAAQTMAFSTLVVGQLIQTFSWRQLDKSEKITEWSKDKFLVTALGASFIALTLSIYVPPLSALFKTQALPLTAWGIILAVASSSAILAKPIVKLLEGRTPELVYNPMPNAA